jgi:hypothetical protein
MDGTATQLLKTLTAPDPRPKEWPQSPQALGSAMKRLGPALGAVGIAVERDRTNRSRAIAITKRREEPKKEP